MLVRRPVNGMLTSGQEACLPVELRLLNGGMDADQEACKWNDNVRARGLSAYRAPLVE